MAALEHRPERLDPVGVDLPPDVLADRVLDASPTRDVGHSVEALADGNHTLVAHLGQDQSQDPPPPELRSPDGFPLNIQNPHSGLAADVHVSLRTFGGGSAFIDEDENGAQSEGEQFPAVARQPV